MSMTSSEKKCPRCNGVPTAPDVEGCKGCIECDFTGTLAGFRTMQRHQREADIERDRMDREHAEYIKRGVCSQCGARSQEEAAGKCRATCGITGDYSCAGDVLWRETE